MDTAPHAQPSKQRFLFFKLGSVRWNLTATKLHPQTAIFYLPGSITINLAPSYMSLQGTVL